MNQQFNPMVFAGLPPVARRAFIESKPYIHKGNITAEQILEAVCGYYKLSQNHVKSASRAHALAIPRHVAMYFIKQKTELSLAAIGKHLGNRDHSTVIHAVKNVENMIRFDKKFSQTIRELSMII